MSILDAADGRDAAVLVAALHWIKVGDQLVPPQPDQCSAAGRMDGSNRNEYYAYAISLKKKHVHIIVFCLDGNMNVKCFTSF